MCFWLGMIPDHAGLGGLWLLCNAPDVCVAPSRTVRPLVRFQIMDLWSNCAAENLRALRPDANVNQAGGLPAVRGWCDLSTPRPEPLCTPKNEPTQPKRASACVVEQELRVVRPIDKPEPWLQDAEGPMFDAFIIEQIKRRERSLDRTQPSLDQPDLFPLRPPPMPMREDESLPSRRSDDDEGIAYIDM